MPGGSFRASSREDSLSSSFFGDSDSVANDDVVISRMSTEEWPDHGLGITEEMSMNPYNGEPSCTYHSAIRTFSAAI